MNKRAKKRFSIKTSYFVPGVFIISIVLLLVVFPRSSGFKYFFTEGKPWQYELLTAATDFPVYKSKEELKEQQDSVLRYFEEYFVIDPEIEKNSIADFDIDVNLDPYLSELPIAYKNYLRNSLLKVFKEGIMNSDDYDRVFSSEGHSLRIKEGNVAEARGIEELHTSRQAYQQIIDDIPESLDNDLIRDANINKYLRDNIVFDASTTEKARNEFIQQISPSRGMVQAGERIIDRGEIVTPQIYEVLNSLKRVTDERSGRADNRVWLIVGQAILIIVLMGSFYLYLLFFRPNEYKNKQHVMFMLLLIVTFVMLTALSVRVSDAFNVYIIPYAIVTILIRTFIDSRTALFASSITIILSGLMLPFLFEFIVIQIIVAMTSIFMLKELTERSQLIRSSFFILLTYSIVYIGLTLHMERDINRIDWYMFLYFLINFIFIMFSYSLVYLIEKSFGFISGVSLVELSNINKPLLKELSEKAPGTFQHSMQVSNLAMEAAEKIGANSSLIRTGALYHDIGKMVNPAFFTENQTPGMNPHEGLPFEESARIIINHVRDGVKIAQKHNLPKQIIEFIETHHGTSMPKYFYISWKNANPGKDINEDLFKYPGPNPFTKETAILMMADTVEAASRSLKEYTEESIRSLVNNLIDNQVSEGYFKMAPITFKDVETVKDVFVDKLKIIYHTRIVYPTLKEE